MSTKKYIFFLGGDDPEMRCINRLVHDAGHGVHDANLEWGAKASEYGTEAFCSVLNEGAIPVLIELELDCEVPNGAIMIDHHGDRSGEAPSLVQVASLIDFTLNREHVLTAAYDAGWVWGLRSIGATCDDVASFLDTRKGESIRAMILSAEKGFSDEILAEADKAVAEAESIGSLTVVHCAHSKTGLVTARLLPNSDNDLKGENTIILSEDGEVNYFGTPEVVRALIKHFKGWSGGAGLMPHTQQAIAFWEQWDGKAPENAFWGGRPDHGDVLDLVKRITS